MKKILFIVMLCIGTFCSHAQTLAEFNALAQKKDTIAQEAMLKKWEKNGSNDPDFYVAAFNYHFFRARKEVLRLGNDPSGKESLALEDKEGNTAGYLGSSITYDDAEVKKAIRYIDKGISKFPDRLDLRFGKIFLLGETKDYGPFTKDIVAVIGHSAKIKNSWMWKKGKPLDDPEEFMLASVQDYVVTLYNTGDDTLLNNMLEIATAVLQYYPDHVESLSNASIVHMIREEPKKALELLLRAEKLEPKDAVVLGNIAQAYVMSGDKVNALKYYEMVIAFGNEDAKVFAKNQIEKNKLK